MSFIVVAVVGTDLVTFFRYEEVGVWYDTFFFVVATFFGRFGPKMLILEYVNQNVSVSETGTVQKRKSAMRSKNQV